jgi:ribosomal protein L37AE/L43A
MCEGCGTVRHVGHRSEPAQQREARGGCDLHPRHFQHVPGKVWLCPTCFHTYAKAAYGYQRAARQQRPLELWPGETMVEYPGMVDGPRRVEGEEPPGAAASDHEREAEVGEAPMDWEEEEPGTGGRKRRKDQGIVEGGHGTEEQGQPEAAAPGPEREGEAGGAPMDEGGEGPGTSGKRRSNGRKEGRIKKQRTKQPEQVGR